jgi:hypothetical protein
MIYLCAIVSLFSQVLFLQENNEMRIVVVSWSNQPFMNQCDPSIICNIKVLIKKPKDKYIVKKKSISNFLILNILPKK